MSIEYNIHTKPTFIYQGRNYDLHKDMCNVTNDIEVQIHIRYTTYLQYIKHTINVSAELSQLY